MLVCKIIRKAILAYLPSHCHFTFSARIRDVGQWRPVERRAKPMFKPDSHFVMPSRLFALGCDSEPEHAVAVLMEELVLWIDYVVVLRFE